MGRGTDVPGAVLITAALMVGVFTIVKPAAELGWTAGADHRPVAADADPAGLLRRPRGDRRQPAGAAADLPLPHPDRREPVQALSSSGMFGIFFLGSLYLQRVLGYDALEIGLAFLPTTW